MPFKGRNVGITSLSHGDVKLATERLCDGCELVCPVLREASVSKRKASLTSAGERATSSVRSRGFTLAEGATNVDKFGNYRKPAFTLAEVLITLGIIGIVASITMPVLMEHYRTKALETGMARFYSVVNQGFTLSAVKNGDEKDWEDFGENSCAFYKKYLADYIKADYECGYYNRVDGKPVKANDDRFVGIYFPSGDMAIFSYGKSFTYTRKMDNRYKAYEAVTANLADHKDVFGTELFMFWRGQAITSMDKSKRPTGIVPYEIFERPGNRLEYCKVYPHLCAVLIVENGWKVPKNYPYKIR